jgi:putative membrane protein
MRAKYQVWIGTAALILLALVVIGGLLYDKTDELFKALTPFTMILSAIIYLWHHKKYQAPFWIFATVADAVGMLVHMVGVNTGYPFGTFTYGPNLGIKLLHTPLAIGIIWFMLVYSAGVITARLGMIKLLKALTGALLIVPVVWLMEPAAMKLDLWHWEGGTVPLQNYLAWFVISFVLLVFFHLSRFKKSNKIAPVAYVTILLFLAALNFLPIN